MPLAPETLVWARQEHANGESLADIALVLRVDEQELQALFASLAPERPIRNLSLRRDRAARLAVRTGAPRTPSLHEVRDPEPPAEVIAERDSIAECQRSLTQELMGDPAPGRSALDRRPQNVEQPEPWP